MSVQIREAVAQRTALYRFYDADGQLLYVGITNDPKTRFAHHSHHQTQTWWPRVHRHTITWFDDRQSAALSEVEAIKSEAPLYNVSHMLLPSLVSTSAAIPITAADFDECEWVTPSEIARRVVSLGIKKTFSRARVMQIAQSDPAWPLPRNQWRSIANMWLFPWPPVESYFRSRNVRQGQRTDLKSPPQPEEESSDG